MFNWAALAAFASLFSVLTMIAVGAFVYGKLTQQVVEGRDNTKEHGKILKVHGEKLEDHGEKIGRLQEWKSGFNTGARLAGSSEVK